MKIMSIIMIFLGLVSSIFSTEESVKKIENQHERTKIYKIPEITQQEEELEARVRDTIIKEIRSFPLKERLEILRFINLIGLFESSINKLYLF